MKILDSNRTVVEFVEVWGRSFTQILSQSGVESPKVEFVPTDKCVEVITLMGQKKHCLMLSGGGRLNGLSFTFSRNRDVAAPWSFLQYPRARESIARTYTVLYRNSSASSSARRLEHARPFCGAPGRDKIEVSFVRNGSPGERRRLRWFANRPAKCRRR